MLGFSMEQMFSNLVLSLKLMPCFLLDLIFFFFFTNPKLCTKKHPLRHCLNTQLIIDDIFTFVGASFFTTLTRQEHKVMSGPDLFVCVHICVSACVFRCTGVKLRHLRVALANVGAPVRKSLLVYTCPLHRLHWVEVDCFSYLQ